MGKLCFRVILIGIAVLIANANSFASGEISPSVNASPIALVADATGTGVYVAEFLPKKIVHVILSDGQEDWSASLPESPTGLVLDAGRERIYVTLNGPQGKVLALDAKTGHILFSVAVGHSPLGPSLSPNGQLLAVCNRFSNSVNLIDIGKQKVIADIHLSREPVASIFTPDGKNLLVTNLLPAGSTGSGYIAATVSLVDPVRSILVGHLRLPNGSTLLRGVAVSPDGDYAYVTHNLGRYTAPTTQVERGWMNTSAITIVDMAERKIFATFLLDDIDLGAANPWGIVCTPDGKKLCVAQAGTHEISIIDCGSLHDRISLIEKGEITGISQTLSDIPNDLNFLKGIRRRVRLPGNGPRSICLVNDQLVAGMYFSDDLAVVPLKKEENIKSINLGSYIPLSEERMGEKFFNDAGLCFQQWQSCASCHSDDARSDGLNWDLLNDGTGNPKKTKSLLMAHSTPPSMSLGIRESAEIAVRSGIRYIQFTVRPEEDAQKIDAYIKSLQPVPSPFLENGSLSMAAKRGKKVYVKANCASCHTSPKFTNLNQYNVGLSDGIDNNKNFDTPTLIECWRTAPYIHDGRANSIKEVLTRYNKNDSHGETSGLTQKEINDLIQYILSL
jgi:DNA-binding beta-propeller fold protein YncE/mono/diheme cytochrome c family protein